VLTKLVRRAACLAAAVLYVLGDVLVPLILAVFVSSMLVPLLDLLTDRPLRLCNRCQPNNPPALAVSLPLHISRQAKGLRCAL
jgi:predicted PurR-regulated permease PerM